MMPRGGEGVNWRGVGGSGGGESSENVGENSRGNLSKQKMLAGGERRRTGQAGGGRSRTGQAGGERSRTGQAGACRSKRSSLR